MSYEINYRGWTLFFDDPPSSKDLEARYEARVTATEVRYPVATPSPLERERGERPRLPLQGRRVAFCARKPGPVSREAFAVLCRLGATIGVAAEQLEEFSAIASDFEDAGPMFSIDWTSDETLYGVVFDATDFETPSDLDALRQVFRPAVMALASSGRAVVISGQPEDAESASQAATWYALDGFGSGSSGVVISGSVENWWMSPKAASARPSTMICMPR